MEEFLPFGGVKGHRPRYVRRDPILGIDDETELQSPFAMGAEVDDEIPWAAYDELEIQGLLKVHFEELGYKVVWRHQDDAANEEGVDLECSRGQADRILLAVKKKASHDDISQVLDLVKHKAAKRIYVYTESASQSFRNNFKEFSNRVEPLTEFLEAIRSPPRNTSTKSD